MSKIPPQAKKVFEGVICDVYQWEQELFDGSQATFEMVSRGRSCFILPIVDNKIILTTEHQPSWEVRNYGLVGGRCLKWEAPIIGAERELKEETWLSFQKLNHWIHNNDNSYFFDRERHYFIAQWCEFTGKQQLDKGWEIIVLQEVSFDQFVELCLNGSINYPDLNLKIANMKVHNKLDELKALFFG